MTTVEALTNTVLSPVTGDYTIDTAHSRIGFVARHAVVTKVRGAFDSYSGNLHLDWENPAASSANLTVEVASINTANDQRDGHLRANDFFDAPSYPQLTFVSTNIEKVDNENFRVTGDLTIKGVTQKITVDWEFNGLATDPYGNVRAGFEGKAILNRSDFDINFNAALETGGLLVSEKIVLEFDISAIKNA